MKSPLRLPSAQPHLFRLRQWFPGILLPWLLVVSPVMAQFPPAPSFTIQGTVSNSFGWPIRDSELAVLVAFRGEKVIGQAPISEKLALGRNYRLALPLVMGPDGGGAPELIQKGDPIHLVVQFPNEALPVSSSMNRAVTIGEPAGILQLDFSVGSDSDGDGIPDDWEFWQLDEAGIPSGDSRYGLDAFSRDGDFDRDGISDFNEYVAGTFAFLNTDGLSLKIDPTRSVAGSPRLRANLVADKFYRIEMSRDLKKWKPVNFAPDGNLSAAVGEFSPSRSDEFIFEVPSIGASESGVFFRLGVR